MRFQYLASNAYMCMDVGRAPIYFELLEQHTRHMPQLHSIYWTWCWQRLSDMQMQYKGFKFTVCCSHTHTVPCTRSSAGHTAFKMIFHLLLSLSLRFHRIDCQLHSSINVDECIKTINSFMTQCGKHFTQNNMIESSTSPHN